MFFFHTYSRRAENSGNRKYVTIKINVNTLSDDYLKGRRAIAQKLFSANPDHVGYTHIRFMLDTFKVKSKHGEHLCIVYDVLREPIDICMEKFPGRRFSCEKIRVLLPALLTGLDYLHTECKVVHTDLKADNIMMGLGDPTILDRFVQRELEHPSPRKMPDSHGRIIYTSCSDFGEAPTMAVIASAKITDIGLAVFGDENNYKPIQSNAFMAPEVILQCGWSYPADIWNLAVMLWDLFENFGLFDSIDTRPSHYQPAKHLGLMIGLMGPPPKEFLKRGAKSHQFFDAQGEFKYPEHILKDLDWEASVSRLRGEEKDLFIDFAKKMITWIPEERWTAKQLLEHPFLTKERDPNYLTPTPSLSRASTASMGSIIPSRAATPGPPPTSHPLAGSSLAVPFHAGPSSSSPKSLERASSRPSTPGQADADLSRPPSRASTFSINSTTLTSRPKQKERSTSDTTHLAAMNVDNKSSQDLINSILHRPKPVKANGIVHEDPIQEEPN